MPWFFFDIDDGENQLIDQTGLNLHDVEAARDLAISILPDIAREVLPDGDRRDFVSIVRAEHDRVIFRAKLSFTAEWVGANDP